VTSSFPTIDRWLSSIESAEDRANGDVHRLAQELRAALLEEMTQRDKLALELAVAKNAAPLKFPEISA
jgi:hypothetical protein